MQFTIGILFDSLYDEYENAIWQDLVKIAGKKQLNLVSFAVGAINSPYEQNAKRNILYKLITPWSIHGIISFTASLGNFSHSDNVDEIFRKMKTIPTVHIGARPQNSPAILINNEVGMFQIMDHLISRHKYRQIAFIRGPVGNKEAELRFMVYKKCLDNNKIPINEDLIVQGDFCRLSGSMAIATLLDERKVKFDAVVSANDFMALDAMIELEKRGFHVPGDVAITGFDDMFESRCTLQPITTVRQPSYEMAKNALEMIINILEKKDNIPQVVLPAKAVIRRSCGCFMFMVSETQKKISPHSINERILEEMNYNFTESIDLVHKNRWINQLNESLEKNLTQKDNSFLTTLEGILMDAFKREINPLTWYPVIFCYFSLMQNILPEDKTLQIIWRDALILVGNLAEHAQANIRISKKIQNYNFHLLKEAFRNIFDFAKQKILLNKHLPEIGIKNFYFGIYPEENDTNQVQVISRFEDYQCREISDKVISIHDFLFDCLHNGQKSNIYTVFPIHSDIEQLGIAVIAVGPNDGNLYETIASQLNATISEATLFNRVQQHTRKLESEVLIRTSELAQANEALAFRNTSISKLYEELEFKSKLDSLTRLYNRTAIYDFLEHGFSSLDMKYFEAKKEFGKYKRAMDKKDQNSLEILLKQKLNHFSVIMMDIDYFKRINDTYGHLFGDKVLRRLSDILLYENIFRRIDICGRFGGEEFIIILPFTEPGEAKKGAERLKENLKHQKIDSQHQVSLSLSMGIAKYHPEDENIECVINRADMAMYYAKENGRDLIINYSDVFGESSSAS